VWLAMGEFDWTRAGMKISFSPQLKELRYDARKEICLEADKDSSRYQGNG
jgi:hypothetical protein